MYKEEFRKDTHIFKFEVFLTFTQKVGMSCCCFVSGVRVVPVQLASLSLVTTMLLVYFKQFFLCVVGLEKKRKSC